MLDDLDELVGGAEYDDTADYHPDNLRHTIPPTITELHGGVTITFLAQLFSMAKHTVAKRLGPLQPLKRNRNAPVYNLAHAAAYLVEPKVDLQEYLRTLRPTEMPTHLQKDFWDAQIKRQKWEYEAKDLWRTADVLDVLSEVFKNFKSATQLWTDNLERVHALSDAQRKALLEAVDALQIEFHHLLVEMPKRRQTPSEAEAVDEDGLPIGTEETTVGE